MRSTWSEGKEETIPLLRRYLFWTQLPAGSSTESLPISALASKRDGNEKSSEEFLGDPRGIPRIIPVARFTLSDNRPIDRWIRKRSPIDRRDVPVPASRRSVAPRSSSRLRHLSR